MYEIDLNKGGILTSNSYSSFSLNLISLIVFEIGTIFPSSSFIKLTWIVLFFKIEREVCLSLTRITGLKVTFAIFPVKTEEEFKLKIPFKV